MPAIAAITATATATPTPALAPVDRDDVEVDCTAGIAVPVAFAVLLDAEEPEVELGTPVEDDKLVVCELPAATVVFVTLHSPKSP